MPRKYAFILLNTLIVILILAFQSFQPTPSQPSSQPTPTSPTPSPSVLGQESSGTYFVSRVIDGDTIEIMHNNQTQKVRLIGVNSPESVDPRRPVECFGKQASDYLRNLLLNQPVTMKADPTQDNIDRYGRLLRYVYLGDQQINLTLIKEGYAYEYTYDLPYQFQTQFRQAQQVAQAQLLGLWNQDACPQTSPALTPTINPECSIKGNISSSEEKIYHLPGCRDYQRTSINQSTGEQWFCTEQEAQQAGWRKAASC